MFRYARYQIIFLLLFAAIRYGNGKRNKRMAYEVLHDELDLAESIIRRQRTADWSARISQGSRSKPSPTSSSSTISQSPAAATVNSQAPRTHITSIIKAIKVLEDIKEEKPTTPPKKLYFKGAYKTLSTSKKAHILPVDSTTKHEKVTFLTTEKAATPFSTAATIRKSTKSSSSAKRDQIVQPLTVASTTPIPKSRAVSSSKNTETLLRRAPIREYTTPHSARKADKVPTAYLLPVDMKITSPADVISKSVTKSIQKIPKRQSTKAPKKAQKSKLKRPVAKKVVIVKKVIKPTAKPTTPPTTAFKYPKIHFGEQEKYREQDDKSEEDYSNEYRKRQQKEYSSIPRFGDSEEDHFRFTGPIKRNRESSFSIEEPVEPRIEYPPFEMPKIDLSASNLNQKGCKTVVKEVQEHPVVDRNASATILHPIFYPFAPYSRKKRGVKSIIVTKECVFPGDDEETTMAPYQPQADNLREIYRPYSSRRPDLLKPQSSKISTDKKEYKEEQNPQRYSKSYSRSYHSTTKPYRKEHSYYSTSKPVVNKYSHSEKSQEGNRNAQHYNRYAPKNFAHETYGFRPDYHHDYQGPSGEESRGVGYHGSFDIPDYSRLARKNYNKAIDYSRPSNHEPIYDHPYENRDSKNEERREGPENNKGGRIGPENKENKPKKSRKSFAYYRKDNDPKNNGFSEQYAQGSFQSYSTDYDSDRDGPKRDRQ